MRLPDRNVPVREPLPALGEINSLVIVRPAGPGPIRQIITGRKTVVTASYASKKNRCAHPAEAETEIVATRHDEVMPHIVLSKPQPFRIEAVVDGKLVRSIPDRIRLLDDGSRSIVEFKRDWRGFERENARLQSLLAQAAADALGLGYEKVTLACLGSPTVRANIDRVQMYRFVHCSVRQEVVASTLLAERDLVPLGELAEAIDNEPRNGFARVCALMVRRIAAIDLTRPLSRDSLVRAVPPLPTFLPSIHV